MEVVKESTPDFQAADKGDRSLTGSGGDRLRTCVRKGDIVCFTKAENIHMAKSGGKYTPQVRTTTADTPYSIDQILSGESLYKSFTFLQGTDDDTDKCIAFWKSVMERNLVPIKCSIIEGTVHRTSDGKSADAQAAPPETEKKEEVDIEAMVDERMKVVHKNYKDMWERILKDAQKKKLEQVKLVGTTRCKMCETLNVRFEDDPCKQTKAEVAKEIKDLNKWKSPSKKVETGYGVTSFVRTDRNDTGTKLQGKKKENRRKSSVSFSSENKYKEPQITGEEMPKDQISLKSSPELGQQETQGEPKVKPPPDSNTYEFVDAIEAKTKSGKYSEWRTNKTETCTCGFDICICNTSPNVTGYKTEVYADDPDELSSRTNQGSGTLSSMGRRSRQEKSNLSLSVVLPCNCSEERCDCSAEVAPLSRNKLPEDQWEYPPPPPPNPLAERRSSTSLNRKRLSQSSTKAMKGAARADEETEEKDGKDACIEESEVNWKKPDTDENDYDTQSSPCFEDNSDAVSGGETNNKKVSYEVALEDRSKSEELVDGTKEKSKESVAVVPSKYMWINTKTEAHAADHKVDFLAQEATVDADSRVLEPNDHFGHDGNILDLANPIYVEPEPASEPKDLPISCGCSRKPSLKSEACSCPSDPAAPLLSEKFSKRTVIGEPRGREWCSRCGQNDCQCCTAQCGTRVSVPRYDVDKHVEDPTGNKDKGIGYNDSVEDMSKVDGGRTSSRFLPDAGVSTQKLVRPRRDSLQILKMRSSHLLQASKRKQNTEDNIKCFQRKGDNIVEICGKRGPMTDDTESLFSTRVRKATSFIYKPCGCKKEQCDCFELTFPERDEPKHYSDLN